MSVTTCTADACRICTGCAHGNHGRCRVTVFCPTNKVHRMCCCCGRKRAEYAEREAKR